MTEKKWRAFIIKWNNWSIKLTILRDFWFPQTTCYKWGYETECKIEITGWNYTCKSHLYISTWEIYNFFIALKKCYEECSWIASLYTLDEDINIGSSLVIY